MVALQFAICVVFYARLLSLQKTVNGEISGQRVINSLSPTATIKGKLLERQSLFYILLIAMLDKISPVQKQ